MVLELPGYEEGRFGYDFRADADMALLDEGNSFFHCFRELQGAQQDC